MLLSCLMSGGHGSCHALRVVTLYDLSLWLLQFFSIVKELIAKVGDCEIGVSWNHASAIRYNVKNGRTSTRCWSGR